MIFPQLAAPDFEEVMLEFPTISQVVGKNGAPSFCATLCSASSGQG